MAKSKFEGDYSRLIREQTRQIDIDTFRERGLTKVNVINAKQINEMIAQAVEAMIAKRGAVDVATLEEDKAQVILESVEEFRRLVKERKEQTEAQAEAAPARDEMREELLRAQAANSSALQNELRDLRAYLVNVQAKQDKEKFGRETAFETEHKAVLAEIDGIKSAIATLTEAAKETAKETPKTKAKAEAAEAKELDKRFDALKTEFTGALSASGKTSAETLKTELGELRKGLEKAVDEKIEARLKEENARTGKALDDIKKAIAGNGQHEKLMQSVGAVEQRLGGFEKALKASGDAAALAAQQAAKAASADAVSAAKEAKDSAEKLAKEAAKIAQESAKAVEGKLAGLETKFTGLDGKLSGVEGELRKIGGENGARQKAVEELSNKVGQIEGAVQKANAGLFEQVEKRIGGVERVLADTKATAELKTALEGITGKLVGVQDALTKANNHALESLGSRLGQLEGLMVQTAAKPAFDAAAVERVVNGALVKLKGDLERGGMGRGMSTELDGVDTSVASTVLNRYFEARTDVEVNLGEAESTTTEGGSVKAKSALDKLKALKRKS